MIKKVTLISAIMTGLLILSSLFNLLLNFSVIKAISVPLFMFRLSSIIYLLGYASLFIFFVVLYKNQKS